nr:galactose-1-phosphate uridylyltransferase [Allostreptomyces psammosilenae]
MAGGTSAPGTPVDSDPAVLRTRAELADGRDIFYYDRVPAATAQGPKRGLPDPRPLPRTDSRSELRHDPMLDEWVIVASHRQNRTYLPPADECPLCPSQQGRHSEIPDPDYEVAVFQNQFPSLSGGPEGARAAEPLPEHPGLFERAPGVGRCEVVCFTSDHDSSFADLSESQAATVLAAWTDRTADLQARADVAQVFCFENRGREIGVTLAHPHGQIYAYPYTTPRTARVLRSLRAHRERTGGNLFDDVLAAERADGARIVLAGEHWTAFVPAAAHWPYEVHLYPNRRVPDLTALNAAERAEFPGLYLDLLRRFDRLFATPAPYIAGWHQAPTDMPDRAEYALHLELFTIRRADDKLKFLAGSESGMGAFANDIAPEGAAERLRQAGV